MKYTKPFLSYDDQASLLLSRGLKADRDVLIERLKSVNYYRLSGYLYPFRLPDNQFKPGTTLDIIWNRYRFDRRLRFMAMDPIERFEISLKTRLIYLHANNHGPFGYTDPANLPMLGQDEYIKFIKTIRDEMRRNKEPFVRHFQKQYGDCHADLPIWMAGELMSFGTFYTFFKGLNRKDRQSIANVFGIDGVVLESWFGCLNTVRNICAHHSRLWNRELGIKPLIPRKNPVWHTPVETPNNRIFGVVTIFCYLLKIIAPQSHWCKRFRELINEFPGVPLSEMGFPSGWENHALWK